MNIGIIANTRKKESESVIRKIIDYTNKKGIIVFIPDYYKDLKDSNIKISPIKEIVKESDFIISVGGDGTFLKTSQFIKDSGKAIWGVNVGHLGFLASTNENEIIEMLEEILNNNYRVENRMILNGKFTDETYYCLNDIVIHMGSTLRIINLKLKLDGLDVAEFRSDGIIFSTPTGSTAYSLASGGPILIPTIDSIIITPISPHNLGHRPFIVSPDTNIEIKLESQHAIISFDGQLQRNLGLGDVVSIKKGEYSIKVIKSYKENYFDLLREKLDWGG
ncbi:NAD(+) kinase [candidate division TA06 bacterium]|uniref:NAD kinase n=1 Tax=candidate division TA06 bacterium TaxID=2250710 RepID=A0A660SGQ4_UNCT6|nr:MAG: NAD(+) kinase [candidate division TA06 bacterium]